MGLIITGFLYPPHPKGHPHLSFSLWEFNGFFWGPKKRHGSTIPSTFPKVTRRLGMNDGQGLGHLLARQNLCLCQACFNVSLFLFQAFFLLRCVFLFSFFFRRGAFGGFWLVGHFLKMKSDLMDLLNKELVNLSLKDMGSGQYNCSVLAKGFAASPWKNTF